MNPYDLYCESIYQFYEIDQGKFNNNDILSIKQQWKPTTGVQENYKLYKTHSQFNRPQEDVRFLPAYCNKARVNFIEICIIARVIISILTPGYLSSRV